METAGGGCESESDESSDASGCESDWSEAEGCGESEDTSSEGCAEEDDVDEHENEADACDDTQARLRVVAVFPALDRRSKAMP